ncbi:UNVERIFIED_CONTAM: hypothetical protein HHA_207720 [Hammondia hammondi]|eukprot:XP_008886917.1 hypothetical protein HHA_207720 [Hammondia hammondi]
MGRRPREGNRGAGDGACTPHSRAFSADLVHRGSGTLCGPSVQGSLPGRTLPAARHVDKKRKHLMEEREAEQFFGGASSLQDAGKHPSLSLQKARLFRSSLFRMQLDKLAKAARGNVPARLFVAAADRGESRVTGDAKTDEEGSDADPTELRQKQRKKQSQASVGARGRGEDSEETEAIAAFLVYLRQMLREAPTDEVSFEKEPGRNSRSPPLTPLLASVSSTSAFASVSADLAGFRFEAPAGVKVVGSFPLGLMSSFDKNVDVAVEMPAHMFQNKDYLNYRYLAKRSAYVERLYRHVRASLSAHFPSSLSHKSAAACPETARRVGLLAPFSVPRVALQLWQGEAAKPILVIGFASRGSPSREDASAPQTPKRMQSSPPDLSAWTVRLLFTPASPLFKEHLLAPTRNCVRAPTFCLRDEGVSAGQEQSEGLPPTPYYNGLVLEDLRMLARQQRMHQCCQEFGEAFRDAVQILKVWASRGGRSLFALPPSRKGVAERGDRRAVPATGVDGATLAMLCGHVCASRRDVASSASAHDIFVLTLSFLSTADFLSSYYVFGHSQTFPRARLQPGHRSDGAAVLSPSVSSSVSSSKDEGTVGRLSLASGVVAEALLFDGDDCIHNLLWRIQLHVAELQQLARSSLRAVETLKDPFDALFAPVSVAGAAERERRSEGQEAHAEQKERGKVAPTGKADAETMQLGLLLENDFHVNLPHIPTPADIRAALRPEASVPLHDYFSYRERPEQNVGGVPGDKSSSSGVYGSPGEAASKEVKRDAGVSERDILRALDEGAKWESPSLRLLAASLLRVLVRALGDRVQSIQMRFTYPTFTALREASTRKEGSKKDGGADTLEATVFGNMPFTWQNGFEDALLENKVTPGLLLSLRLNGASATRTLDRGPPAAVAAGVDEAVESFKAFWGAGKVELRRFQDAQILNTVLWRGAVVPPAGPSHLFSRTACAATEGGLSPPHVEIISYALRRHFPTLFLLRGEGAGAGEAETQDPEEHEKSAKHAKKDGRHSETVPRAPVSCWLQSSPLTISGGVRVKDREVHKALLQAFSELKNTICSLSGVPLTVKQARSTSPALRYFDLPVNFSPVLASTEAGAEHDMRTVHPVVLEFESSSGWPDDPLAIRKIKTAFLLAMQSELLSDYGISGTVTEDFLDVEVTAFIFRLSIFHPADVLAAGAVYAEPSSEPLARHLKGLPERLVGLGSHAGDSLRVEDGSEGDLCNADSLSGEQEARDKDDKVAEILSLLTADDEDGSASRKNGLDFLGLALLSGIESDAKRLMKQEMQSLQQLRHLWWEPQIAGVLHACAMRFPAFGGSVWLVWQWLGEMQLPGLFRVAEHLTATVFVDHRRHGFAAPPQSPQVAFLRFLHLVAKFEWRSRPLRVCFDLDTPLNAEQERLSDASFDRFRLYPTIHTVFDPHGFLIPTAEPATFDRFVQNARSALLKLSGTLSRPSTTADVWREVFTPDLRSFDIVLSLVDPLRARTGAASKTASHKRYANVESIHTTDNSMSLCGLEMPACRRRYLFLRLIGQLREAYSDALILAYNPVAASLMAGGMPAFLALKIRPGPLILRRADPAVLLPLCGIQTNEGGSDSEEEHTDGEDRVKRKKPKQSCSFELTVNPVLLVSSLMSMAHGLVESVHVLP